MYSAWDAAEAAGCPIRKSTDRSLLTAPRGLSQRATSFIASQRQGIHQMPLKRLKEPSSTQADKTSAARNNGSHDQHKKNYHVLCIIRSRPAPGQGRNLADRQPRRKKTSSQFQRPWQPSPEPKPRQTRKPRTRPFPATKPPTPLAGGTSRQYRPPSIGGTAGAWWSRTGSNRRPEACKATALPTELRPLDLPPAIRGRAASKIPAPGARRENGGPR